MNTCKVYKIFLKYTPFSWCIYVSTLGVDNVAGVAMVCIHCYFFYMKKEQCIHIEQ